MAQKDPEIVVSFSKSQFIPGEGVGVDYGRAYYVMLHR